MHMKLRYFSWLATPSDSSQTEVVVSGSLNPEKSAAINEDTLLVVKNDPATVAAYKNAVQAVLGEGEDTNNYDDSKAINVLFSQVLPRLATGCVKLMLLCLTLLINSARSHIHVTVVPLIGCSVASLHTASFCRRPSRRGPRARRKRDGFYCHSCGLRPRRSWYVCSHVCVWIYV